MPHGGEVGAVVGLLDGRLIHPPGELGTSAVLRLEHPARYPGDVPAVRGAVEGAPFDVGEPFGGEVPADGGLPRGALALAAAHRSSSAVSICASSSSVAS